jgi:small subunit ribosomal protein S11
MTKVKKRSINTGVVHINAGFNNTIISVTDLFGNVLYSSSSGRVGLRSSKKSTAYAGKLVAEDVAKNVINNFSMKTVSVIISGPSESRDSSIRALHSSGLIISYVTDITSIVHNGCRPPKRRRM